MSPTDAIFQKYHKNLDDLIPCLLPGRPSSFQGYLKSVFAADPSFDVDTDTAYILCLPVHLSTKTPVLEHFFAACFPPIKVGSFAGECIGFTFEDDVFLQFTDSKGYLQV